MSKNSLVLSERNFSDSIIELMEEPQQYKLALSYFRDGDTEQALREFRCLNINKGATYKVSFNMGLIYWYEKDYGKANNYFQEAFLRAKKGLPKTRMKFFYLQSLFFLSFWHFNRREFHAMESLFRESRKINFSRWNLTGDNYEIYRLVKSFFCLIYGFLVLKEENTKEALRYFKKALKWNKRFSLAYYCIAILLARQNNYSGSYTYISRALEHSSRELYLLSTGKLVSWFSNSGKVKKKNPFQEIPEDKLDPVTVRNLSWMVFQNGSPGSVIKYIDRGISLLSSSSSLFIYRGFCLEKLNQIEEALQCYQKAFEIDDFGILGDLLLGRAFYLYSHYSRAKGFFLKALKEDKKSEFALAYLSEIALKEGNYDESVDYLRRLLSLKKKYSIPVLLYLMKAYYLKGDVRKALNVSADALIFDINQFYRPGLRFFRSLIYLESGRPETALKELNDSLRFDPDNPLALTYKGFILTLMGKETRFLKNRQINRAAQFFKDSLLIDPSLSVTYLHLIALYSLKNDMEGKNRAREKFLTFEAGERDLNIFKNFFPDLYEELKSKVRVISSSPCKISHIIEDDAFLNNFSPFKVSARSGEEEFLFFYNAYKVFSYIKSDRLLFLSLLSGTLTGKREPDRYTVKFCEKLTALQKNDVLVELLNDFYLQQKIISPGALENYKYTFALKPDKVSNTVFLSKILRERDILDGLSLPVYQMCNKLKPYDRENLMALVRTLLINRGDREIDIKIYLEAYHNATVDFPERSKLLIYLAKHFLSCRSREETALKIYREALGYDITEDLKEDIYNILAGVCLDIRRLDSEALDYYISLYLRYKDRKDLILICASAMFLSRRTDEMALDIYRKTSLISPKDRANFLMMVYCLIEHGGKEEYHLYLEKACFIIESDQKRYRNSLWKAITDRIIISLAEFYSREERKDKRALDVYKKALILLPHDKKLSLSLLLSLLENSCSEPEFFEFYAGYYRREDISSDLREKIMEKLIELLYFPFSVPEDYEETVYGIYKKLFSQSDWSPGKYDLERLWSYFLRRLASGDLPEVAGGLINYLGKAENLRILKSNESIPFREGFVYIFMDYIEGGIECLRDGYSKNPGGSPAGIVLYCLARLNFELGRYDRAVEFIDMIEPQGGVSTTLEAAGLYFKLGKKEQAGHLYRKVLENVSSEEAETIREIARTYRESNPAVAEKFYGKLFSLIDGDAEAGVFLGKIALEKKSFEEAYSYFIKYPGEPSAMEGLGHVYYYIDKYRNAKEIFSVLLKEKRDLSSSSLFLLGECLKKEGKLEKAIEIYSLSIERGYETPCVYLARGQSLRKLGRLKSCAYDFGQFIRISNTLSGNYLDALISLAEVAEELGDMKSSLNHWIKAFSVALIPESVRKSKKKDRDDDKIVSLKSCLNLSPPEVREKLLYIANESVKLCLKLKKYSPCELPLLNFYLKYSPGKYAVLLYRADLLYQMARNQEEKGKIEAAELIYRKIVSTSDHILSLLALGRILNSRNSRDEALSFWEKAADRGPVGTDIYRALYIYYFEKKSNIQAIKYLDILIRQDFREDEFYTFAELLFIENLWEKAVEILEIGTEHGLSSYRLYYLLGRAYFESPVSGENLDKALYYASLAHKEDSENPEAISLLGDIYFRRGETEKAKEEFEKLPSHLPGKYYKLGLLFYSDKKLKDALDCFELVYETDCRYEDITERLAGLYVELKSFNPGHLEFIANNIKDIKGWPKEKFLEAIEHLHNNYVAHSQWDRGVELLKNSIEKDILKTEKKLWAWLVTDYLETGEIEKASSILNNLPLEEGGSEEEILRVYRLFAEKLIEGENYSGARKVYEQIYRVAPEFSGVGRMLEMLLRENIGRFALIEPAGTGANAKIWKAFDMLSLRTVALKVLHRELRDNEAVKKELERECHILTELNFPGIVKVIPDSRGEYYFAMELLDYSLTVILKDLTMSRTLEIASQIAEILEQLHQKFIVYQDLSPDNIMFSGNMLKICDFGGAKKLDTDTGKTVFDGTVAHLSYASPEQCFSLSGGKGDIGITSDIYSFGVLLYEMSTGELPFNLPDQQLIAAHQYSQPVPPMVKKPSLSKELNDVIMKCMEKRPEDRFQSMKDIWIILQKIPRRP